MTLPVRVSMLSKLVVFVLRRNSGGNLSGTAQNNDKVGTGVLIRADHGWKRSRARLTAPLSLVAIDFISSKTRFDYLFVSAFGGLTALSIFDGQTLGNQTLLE